MEKSSSALEIFEEKSNWRLPKGWKNSRVSRFLLQDLSPTSLIEGITAYELDMFGSVCNGGIVGFSPTGYVRATTDASEQMSSENTYLPINVSFGANPMKSMWIEGFVAKVENRSFCDMRKLIEKILANLKFKTTDCFCTGYMNNFDWSFWGPRNKEGATVMGRKLKICSALDHSEKRTKILTVLSTNCKCCQEKIAVILIDQDAKSCRINNAQRVIFRETDLKPLTKISCYKNRNHWVKELEEKKFEDKECHWSY